MTFSMITPLKILVACCAVAALVATTMSGSESAGLKGSRKLQLLGLSSSGAVNSIISNSFGIIAATRPSYGPAAVNSITANSAGIIAASRPSFGPATVNSISANSAGIIAALNPASVDSITANSAGIIAASRPSFGPGTVNSISANSAGIIAALNPTPSAPEGPATSATNAVLAQSAEIFKGLTNP